MSVPTATIPPTSARVIGVVAGLGAAVVGVHAPVAGAGALAGAIVVGILTRVTRANSSALLAVLLPVSALVTVGTLGGALTRSPLSLCLTAAMTLIGASVAVIVSGGGSAAQLSQIGAISRHVTVIALAGLLIALGIGSAGGAANTAGILGVIDTGPVGVVVVFLIAGIICGAGLLSLPFAMLMTPRYRHNAHDPQTTAAVIVAVVFGAVGCLVAVGVVVAGRPQVLVVNGWPVIRLFPVVATGVGVTLITAGQLTRYSWLKKERRPPVSPTLSFLGSLAGFVIMIVAILVFRGPQTAGGWVSLFGLVAGLAAGSWVLCLLCASKLRGSETQLTPSVAALLLCLSGVIVGAGAELTRVGFIGVGTDGLVALGAITAGLAVHQLGRFGRILGREVGAAGANRRPQLVRAGWVGLVSLFGIGVATAGIWLSSMFAPTLSVPATVVVVLAIIALRTGIRRLLRE
ncbi:MAG: hypothetical protein J07HX5_00350 [halophilic archaeon J07HX5]|jgi:hypothetical protein|nr:MAG: hypothetical protein J07HX5_00350 [halophilic archaeon J07HX5]